MTPVEQNEDFLGAETSGGEVSSTVREERGRLARQSRSWRCGVYSTASCGLWIRRDASWTE